MSAIRIRTSPMQNNAFNGTDALPYVSVLTPTWNRSAYLQRVWEGLQSQTYRDFEWIVADDGSSDETQSTIRSLAARSTFPIRLLSASVHVGKARMDNEAVARARGHLIIWNDSDDYLLPEALKELVECWLSIPDGTRDGYVAVSALCATTKGAVLNELAERTAPFDSTWNRLAHDPSFSGDMLQFVRAASLKSCKFPEVDFVVPESVVWSALGDQQVRVLPKVLKVVQYQAPHAISFSPKQEYCRGRAYALAITARNVRAHAPNWRTLIRRALTFTRYSVHGEIPVREQWSLIQGTLPLGLWLLAYPAGWALAFKDRIQGKVRYTHREFESARRHVVINDEQLPSALSNPAPVLRER